jgi:hypothetical protein
MTTFLEYRKIKRFILNVYDKHFDRQSEYTIV